VKVFGTGAVFLEKGQVYALPSGTRFVVESNPNEFCRVDIRDEKTGAKLRVHAEFFNGKRLVEQRAVISGEERMHA
jgi:hypothetical protein